jgi:glycerol uptake facilitator-like aquaporin
MNAHLRARLVAEFLGTAFLLAAVIGSRVMGERLAGGNVAIALLANTISTGTILVVLILALGPISGAHFNPAVTLAMAIEKRTTWREFRICRRPTHWFVCRSRTSVDSIAP